MRLVCPSCGSQYDVDVSLFPEEGREVQCSSCDNTWVQYPVKPEESQPLRLDTAAATEPVEGVSETVTAAASPRPSDRLSEEERASLRAAVEEEIAVRDKVDTRRHEPEEEDELDESTILASLREQIALEGEDFDDGKAAKSQRRNLKAAAEAVGISVSDDEEQEKPTSRTQRTEGPKDPARTKLAEALKEYEEERRERRKTGRIGFAVALVLCAVGLVAYLQKDAITNAYPQAGPFLESFAGLVDQGRDAVEDVYARYSPAITEQVNGLLSGDEEAPAE